MKIEPSLNILHYCLYRGCFALHLFFNKINPFNLIHKLPFQKRRYEELGIDIHKEINKAFGDKRYGMSMVVAGGALFGLLFFLLTGSFHLIIQLINVDMILTLPYFVVFALISFAICYIYVFKSDKYLKYFKQFEKWSRAEKRRYAYLSTSFIIGVSVILIGSFML